MNGMPPGKEEHDTRETLERMTRERQLEEARARLHRIVDQYIQAEAEVRALEQGTFRVVILVPHASNRRIVSTSKSTVSPMLWRNAASICHRRRPGPDGGG